MQYYLIFFCGTFLYFCGILSERLESGYIYNIYKGNNLFFFMYM